MNTIQKDAVSQAPARERVNPTTGLPVSPWEPARSEIERARRETRLSGLIASQIPATNAAAREYALEVALAGGSGYKSAVRDALAIFPNSLWA